MDLFDRFAERIAFILGPCLFAVLVGVGIPAFVYHWSGFSLADYFGAVGGGAGLLTIGGGIHRAARAGRPPG